MKGLETFLVASYRKSNINRKMEVLQSTPAANPVNVADAANSPVAQYIVCSATYGGVRRAREFLKSYANRLPQDQDDANSQDQDDANSEDQDDANPGIQNIQNQADAQDNEDVANEPIRYKFERAKEIKVCFNGTDKPKTIKISYTNFNKAVKKYFGIPSATKFSIARVTIYEKEVQPQPPQGPGQEAAGNQPQDQNPAPDEPKKYKVVSTEVYVPFTDNFKYYDSYRTPGQKHEQNNAPINPNHDLKELKFSDVLFEAKVTHLHPDPERQQAFTYKNQASKSRPWFSPSQYNGVFIKSFSKSHKAKLTWQFGTIVKLGNKIKLTHKDNEFANIKCYRDAEDKIAKITGEISEHRFHNQANQRWYVYWENISPANSIYDELETITSFIHKYQAKNNDAAVSQAAAMLDVIFGMLQYQVNWQDMIRITTGKVFDTHHIDNYVKSHGVCLIKINKTNLLARYEESDLKNSDATTEVHVLLQQFISLISTPQGEDITIQIENLSKLFDKNKRSPDLSQDASADKILSPKDTMNFFLDQILGGLKIFQNINPMDEVDGNDKVKLINIWNNLLTYVYNPYAKFADCMEAIKNGNINEYSDFKDPVRTDKYNKEAVEQVLKWLIENDPNQEPVLSQISPDDLLYYINPASAAHVLKHRDEQLTELKQLAEANNEAQAQPQHNQHMPDMDEDENAPDMAAPTNHMDYGSYLDVTGEEGRQ